MAIKVIRGLGSLRSINLVKLQKVRYKWPQSEWQSYGTTESCAGGQSLESITTPVCDTFLWNMLRSCPPVPPYSVLGVPLLRAWWFVKISGSQSGGQSNEIGNDLLRYHHSFRNLIDLSLQVTQIASGLAYLHGLDPPVVHGDIKAVRIILVLPRLLLTYWNIAQHSCQRQARSQHQWFWSCPDIRFFGPHHKDVWYVSLDGSRVVRPAGPRTDPKIGCLGVRYDCGWSQCSFNKQSKLFRSFLDTDFDWPATVLWYRELFCGHHEGDPR